VSQTKPLFASGRPESEIGCRAEVLGTLPAATSGSPESRRKKLSTWRQDPAHPSLRFRRLKGSEDRFSVRVGDHYRALGRRSGKAVVWVWIGSHADYDRLMGG
jgi:hypothetical protein